jgi:toxin YoeB
MYEAVFYGQAKDDYKYWAKHNKAIRDRIDALIKDMLLHPFEGLGSPKPLNGKAE